MNKILYIIRGIPGSGKSSLAKSLGGKHVEADMYHLDENGNYNWKPVDVKKEGQQKKVSTETTQVKVTAKPAAPAKETTVQNEKVQAVTVKQPRWDVQIGAFASKENALQLMQDVKAKGYTAYLTEDKKDGAPFYKVRVKNPEIGREEGLVLSKKLEKDGYPFFLVEIK